MIANPRLLARPGSITHVPAAEQRQLISRTTSWLKPGGTLVASLGVGEAGEWTEKWLGTTMFFGHCGEEAALESLRGAGMTIRRSQVDRQDNEDATFLWIKAVKAGDPDG